MPLRRRTVLERADSCLFPSVMPRTITAAKRYACSGFSRTARQSTAQFHEPAAPMSCSKDSSPRRLSVTAPHKRTALLRIRSLLASRVQGRSRACASRSTNQRWAAVRPKPQFSPESQLQGQVFLNAEAARRPTYLKLPPLREIRVTCFSLPGVVGSPVGLCQRPAILQPLDQVGIRDVRPAEGDQVS